MWNTTRLKTSFVSITELTAEVPADLVAKPGAAVITVHNVGDYTSNAMTFGITGDRAPAPLPIPDVEQGITKSGYVIVTADTISAVPLASATLGIVNNAVVLSQAGVLPTLTVSDSILFVDVLPAASRNLGVAVANPTSSINPLTITLRDENGLTVGRPLLINLQPRQQIARFITELFDAAIFATGFRGSLRIESPVPFAVLGLRFSGSLFSTQPPGGISGTLGGAAIIFPQFAIAGGWATQIALVNGSNTTISGRVDLFDQSGNPMPVTLNGQTQSTFTYSIAPAGAVVFAPRDVNGLSPF
jgi:hypothetical protein